MTNLREVVSAKFSPDGGALFVDTLSSRTGGHNTWLIPTNDPCQHRAVGGRVVYIMDYDGQRLLYSEWGEEWSVFRRTLRSVEKLLIVEDAVDGTRTVIARVPDWHLTGHNVRGCFLPGRPEIAVAFPDRFALVDPSGGTPRKLFSLDGAFDVFYRAPSGQRGILTAEVAEGASEADPALTFVDPERGTSRRLEGAGIEPAHFEGIGGPFELSGRWVLLSVGGDEDSPQALVSLDSETGAMTPLLALAGRPGELGTREASADGRIVLLERRVDAKTTRVTILDLEKGRVTEFDEPGSVSMDLSRDGRWAAYSTVEATSGGQKMALTIVETATGKTTLVGPGLEPVWLAP